MAAAECWLMSTLPGFWVETRKVITGQPCPSQRPTCRSRERFQDESLAATILSHWQTRLLGGNTVLLPTIHGLWATTDYVGWWSWKVERIKNKSKKRESRRSDVLMLEYWNIPICLEEMKQVYRTCCFESSSLCPQFVRRLEVSEPVWEFVSLQLQ